MPNVEIVLGWNMVGGQLRSNLSKSEKDELPKNKALIYLVSYKKTPI